MCVCVCVGGCEALLNVATALYAVSFAEAAARFPIPTLSVKLTVAPFKGYCRQMSLPPSADP